ncbi:FAD-dependent oxidoreductase [Streptomyces sp. bgisy082]|uniref:NAD(P)/FAD-dependent oxidoreductase n=1 Tax=Streptomyces sp. bgisy082 TaxID=3413776 RepID=UPI003D7184DA
MTTRTDEPGPRDAKAPPYTEPGPPDAKALTDAKAPPYTETPPDAKAPPGAPDHTTDPAPDDHTTDPTPDPTLDPTPDPAPDHTTDLTVIGAGPAGLYAAYYAGFRGLSTTVVDTLAHPGGQVAALYPEKFLYDIAGHPAIRGRDLVDNLLAQSAPFGTRYLLGQTATTLVRDGDGWLVGTDVGRLVRTGAVVITAGLGSFSPRTLPCAVPYEGRGVAYHVARLDDHRDQDVVVVGGGDSAVDWALALAPLARSVTLVHRRGAFRAHEHSVAQLHRSPVDVLTDARVTACHGGAALEGVRITSGDTVLERPAQALVAALGFTSRLGPIADWGLALDNRRISVDRAMRTSLPGVYAAGDGCDHPGRVPLISVGFGEAATAVNHAAVALRPGSRLAPEHSSDTVPPPVATPGVLAAR